MEYRAQTTIISNAGNNNNKKCLVQYLINIKKIKSVFFEYENIYFLRTQCEIKLHFWILHII